MAFWNMAQVEPKRNFRYKVTFGANTLDSQLALFAQKVKKPTFKLETKPYQYLNHTFNYPGRVKWEPSSIDFVDPGGSANMLDVASTLFKITIGAGYIVPTGRDQLTTISKEALYKQVGDLKIEQLNAAGAIVETWKMYNVMFTDMTFPELSYDTDEFTTIQVAVVYDYATLLDPSTQTELPQL